MTPQTKIRVAAWTWIAVSTISTVATVIMAVPVMSGWLFWVVVGISAAQTAVAIPAAIAMQHARSPKIRNVGRLFLIGLAWLCVSSLAKAIEMAAWPSLVLNLVLALTLGLLMDKEVKAVCRGEHADSPQHPNPSAQQLTP
ncbi:hypothetical protein [Saccharopolyspora griseoalba]|uniref:Uncharacterized protein n=1 Tax=Saccharopolyspora griseoalba TaxID=1431848 RepID=A0ABW2LTH1_9PSEU